MPTENLGLIIKRDKTRQIIYGIYIIAVIIAGAIQVGYASIRLGQPDWLTAALAVLAYLGAPIGGLAIVNAGTRAPASVQAPANVQAPTPLYQGAPTLVGPPFPGVTTAPNTVTAGTQASM